MKKLMAIIFAIVLVVPTAFASQPIVDGGIQSYTKPSIIAPPIMDEQKARSIVGNWGITVTYAELNYGSGYATWDLYGYTIANVGPAKVKMNVIVKLDATTGDFVSLEVKKSNQYDKQLIYERMKELGISVQSMSLVRDYNHYWEVYGTKYIDLSGFGFDIQLYIKVDARSGKILEINQQPFYHIMDRIEPTRDVTGGMAEIAFPTVSTVPYQKRIVDKWEPELQTIVDQWNSELTVDPIFEEDAIVVVD